MPHIVVKLWPGRTDEQKSQLAEKIVEAVAEALHAPESSISVAFDEIPSERWAKEVYKPEILDKADTLYKKPGYTYSESDWA